MLKVVTKIFYIVFLISYAITMKRNQSSLLPAITLKYTEITHTEHQTTYAGKYQHLGCLWQDPDNSMGYTAHSYDHMCCVHNHHRHLLICVQRSHIHLGRSGILWHGYCSYTLEKRSTLTSADGCITS